MTQKKKPAPAWQNRIVGQGVKAAKEFYFNPLNWREHGSLQRDALNSVLSQIGWVTGVIENLTTGNLIDGHARIEEALKQGPDTQVPFTQVELSEEEEAVILALFDPIGNLATTDLEKLSELVATINIEETSLLQVLDGLMPSINLEELTNNEPNLSDPNFNYQSQYGVIVECTDEIHQKEVFDRLAAEGLKVKVVVV